MIPFLAHSETDASPEGHLLRAHLEGSARLAEGFFVGECMQALARLAGDVTRHHDAGKYRDAFQARVRGQNPERVDHSTLGGQLLLRRYGAGVGRLLAFAVLGHHGGLPNGVSNEGGRASLSTRLDAPPDDEAIRRFQMENPAVPPAPMPRLAPCEKPGFEIAMLVRMLHSALVDADYLDTERYFSPQVYAARRPSPELSSLLARYEAHMARLEAGAEDTHVNRIRREIRAQCEEAARLPKGFFTLTVPTGGGKTLASLGFVLRHAREHPEIRRIIYAIPFTSIIDQNAGVFRDAVGAENVLEHHSAVNWSERPDYAHLAAENWDAPLIVTTNIQLFESLYAANPAKCRKTHNLINSIIILDEAQALPDAMLKPCLQALCSLVRGYGATVVLMTATQPDFSNVWVEKPETREIIRDVPALFASLSRTRTTMLGALSDEALLERLAGRKQALCIVNTRAHAQALYRAQKGREGAYHLSALMCPTHRERKLCEIRSRLDDGLPCVVFSTSLVEAGVDVDFPCVFRALTGLDSVAQAAGRCNRNGKMTEPGEVYVFRPEAERQRPDAARLGVFLDEIVRLYPDLAAREAMDHFFRLRFSSQNAAADPLDERSILRRIEEHKHDGMFPFAQIARDFQMIRDAGEPVFIPVDEHARTLIGRLESGAPLGETLRTLRRYAVTLYPNQLRELRGRGLVRQIGDVNVLDAGDEQLKTLYTEDCGLELRAEMPTLFA